MKTIQETLDEREQQHGSFSSHCEIESELMCVTEGRLHGLSDVQKVGLHMILHKVARILNDGHNHADSWHDISGYSTLVEQHMTPKTDFEGGTSVG